MRALLGLIAGGPGRVATSAAAIVTIAFLLAGHGHELLIASWFAFIWGGAFVLAFAVLSVISAATGVADGDSRGPAQREADRG